MADGFPEKLWLVRHGESAGNVARFAAEREGRAVIEIDAARELDVPLSPLGERQARALSLHFAGLPENERPTAALSSPYTRARQTAALVIGGMPALPLAVDERLREKEFGILNRLTGRGIREKFPDLVALRQTLGKMYFRPPGGESWCDILLRLRSFLDTATREHPGGRLLIVSHQVVVLLFRALLEGLGEEELLAIDREHDIANCSLTEYQLDRSSPGRGMRLVVFNQVAPLLAEGERVTQEKDADVGPR